MQRADRGESAFILKRGARSTTAFDSKYVSGYLDRQDWARRFARDLDVASFAPSIIADTLSRVIPRAEQFTADGDWVESEDPRLVGIMDEYRNTEQTPGELIGTHGWHYQVAGEMLQTMRDTPQGVEWRIFSTRAVEMDKPGPGFATCKLIPDGKLSDETAFVVPRAQIQRFWLPDREYQGYATSPMFAAIDALHRYSNLAGYANHTAESQLALNGLVWMPDDGWIDERPADPGDQEDASAAISGMEKQYWQVAKQRFSDQDDISSIAPHFVHWPSQYGPPQWVKLGEALDPSGIAYRAEARGEYARASSLPASIIEAGGPGDANHWTEWLNQDRFAAAIAPIADRIFHQDITWTFLRPRLTLAGYDTRLYRIGYDPAPVVVRADQSELGVRLWMAGLIGREAALELANIDPSKMATQADLDWLMQVITKAAAGAEAPAGPGTVSMTPPNNGNAPTPTNVAAVLGTALLAAATNGNH
ncbi:MAG TPA: hypothetical protein VNB03_13685 [Casimicrobiaceae bacterium]|nr:hypothetical protein [Casimicrobiaceae bacterium]